MAAQKRMLGIDVLTAARKRISWAFDTVPRICVSFSGGKDSTVMLHLVAEEAKRRERRFSVLFIDWEAQFKLTINHVRECFDLYSSLIEPYWVCLPFRTVNACSTFEPEWTCWEPGRIWVRDIPCGAITDPSWFPFYYYGMTFEEFAPAFGRWFAGDKLGIQFVGIRAGESLNRWRAVATDKAMLDNQRCSTWILGSAYNCYPIYDWTTEDIWTYFGRTGKPYNRLYDRMHQAGLTPHQMRICEPFGNEQRKGLWLYHVVEPETWAKVCDRVAGANSASLYAKTKGNILGNGSVSKPSGHSWESYANFLLETMPTATSEHYKNKISVYIHWWMERDHPHGIPDEQDGDTGAKDVPSWRRICRVILRGDYWCKQLVFSPTKGSAYQRYQRVMKNRRKLWGIY